MTDNFHPSVDDPEHAYLESLLHRVCSEHSIPVLDVPTYKMLPDPQVNRYARDFSHESLYIRSLPDKFVLTRKRFFVDAKSTHRKDTGNISIELSAYYFDLRRVKQKIRVCFLYEERGEPRVFSPLNARPSFIIIQPWWTGKQRRLFVSYADFIAEHLGVELGDNGLPVRNIETGGSGDPCVIISIKSLWDYSASLENFLIQMNASPYHKFGLENFM